MRYYEREHVEAYARIKAAGLNQWSDLHEELAGLDDFPNRAFLDRVLPAVVAPEPSPTVLEYGCGTGPAACFLAARGYDVRGIDLVPDAIEMARRNAVQRGLRIRFDVADVCAWDEDAERYDVVLDSFCLQSIVLDGDRDRVLRGVRNRVAEGGRFVLSTALYTQDRDYGDDHRDPVTGIVWQSTPAPGEDARQIDTRWYLPHRRHLTPTVLRAELERHGFRVVARSETGGDLVCAVA